MGEPPRKKKGLAELYAIPARLGLDCPSCDELIETGDLTSLLSDAEDLVRVYCRHWDMSNIEILDHAFANCINLEYLDPSLWNTQSLYDIRGVFANCSSLTSINCRNWNTRKVVDMSQVFCGCSSLEAIDISGWDFSNCRDASEMFKGCSELKRIDVRWNSLEAPFTSMFEGCGKLEELDLTEVVGGYAPVRDMFKGCRSLRTLVGGQKGTNLVALDLITDSLDLSDCVSLDRDSVRAVINAGKDQFLIRPESLWSRAPFASIKVAKSVFGKLTSEDIGIAEKKGWNITI